MQFEWAFLALCNFVHEFANSFGIATKVPQYEFGMNCSLRVGAAGYRRDAFVGAFVSVAQCWRAPVNNIHRRRHCHRTAFAQRRSS